MDLFLGSVRSLCVIPKLNDFVRIHKSLGRRTHIRTKSYANTIEMKQTIVMFVVLFRAVFTIEINCNATTLTLQ